MTLIHLCEAISVENANVPGWHLSSESFRTQSFFRSLNGSFNLGLAHGITGILSFLSVAYLRGVQVPNQKSTIERISTWIRDWSFLENKMVRWPYQVSWEEEIGVHPPLAEPSREGWCYGVPGISRALYLAGKVLPESDLKNFSMRAFFQLFNRSPEEWGVKNSALCHGLAGILIIAKLMALEEGGEALAPNIEDLEDQIVSSYNPAAPFGFEDPERDQHPQRSKMSVPGYLEGTTGILLSLLPLTKTKNPWYVPLMIHD